MNVCKGLGQDYLEWTLRGEFSHCRVQVTFDGDTGAALGCQVVQDTGTPGSAKILSAASVAGAGAARELLPHVETTKPLRGRDASAITQLNARWRDHVEGKRHKHWDAFKSHT